MEIPTAGSKGYYLTENGEHVWGDLSREIGMKAAELRYIPSPNHWILTLLLSKLVSRLKAGDC